MNAERLQASYLDQDDFWTQLEPDEFRVEDTIETRSERPSSEPSQAFDNTRDVVSARQIPPGQNQGALPLLQLADWSKDRTYNAQRLTYIQYTIEWKVAVNGKQVAKQTEPNLVLAPNGF
jgi:hypothetical protein